MTGVRIGVDVGGTKAAGVALDADLRVVATAQRSTRRGPEGVVATIRGVVADLTANPVAADHVPSATARTPAVSAVGVGVPGIVAGGIVRHAVNLAVGEMDLASELRADLRVPVAVDNDVRAAALGAHAAFGGTLAYLNLGTGIAAGIVFDGRVRRGSTGAAGEIGHVSIDPAGPVCACGQRGCIEAFAGGAAIARRWGGEGRELVGAVADPSSADRARTNASRDVFRTRLAVDADRPAAHAVFDAADRGDARATRIRDDAVRAIAAAAQILILTADVDRIVLGGGVARLGDRLRDLVARDLDRAAAASPFLTELRIADRIEIDPPGSNAPAIGAALLTG